MFEFQFKDIPENGSFAGKTIILPTPSGDKETIIDALPSSRLLMCKLKHIWNIVRNRLKSL